MDICCLLRLPRLLNSLKQISSPFPLFLLRGLLFVFFLIYLHPVQGAEESAPRASLNVIQKVNDAPITDLDLQQRMILLSVLAKPASRKEALESLIRDALYRQETTRFGLKAPASDLGTIAEEDAKELKMESYLVLLQAFRTKGVSEKHIKNYYESLAVWRRYVRLLNKSVSVPEAEVQAGLRRLSPAERHVIEYTVRQIIFIVPIHAPDSVSHKRKAEAESLRQKFKNCEQGVKLAQSFPDVVVKEPFIRTSTDLTPHVKEMIQKVPVGGLTPPEDDPNGIMVIAVCKKAISADDSSIRTQIREKLLTKQLAKEEKRLYDELRARAILTK